MVVVMDGTRELGFKDFQGQQARMSPYSSPFGHPNDSVEVALYNVMTCHDWNRAHGHVE